MYGGALSPRRPAYGGAGSPAEGAARSSAASASPTSAAAASSPARPPSVGWTPQPHWYGSTYSAYAISCAAKCSEAGYGTAYADDKKFGKDAFNGMSVAETMTSLLEDGPLSAQFVVYDDFPTYKSGVYQKTSSTQLGGHAVLMLGWGVEDGTPYWLIKNSWNEQWGDGGYFKMLRGSNECGIEQGQAGISF